VLKEFNLRPHNFIVHKSSVTAVYERKISRKLQDASVVVKMVADTVPCFYVQCKEVMAVREATSLSK